MSLTDTDVAAVYDANGSTDTFAIPCDYIDGDASNEIKVYVVDEDTGIMNASTLQVEGSDYDLDPAGDTPTNVIFGTAPEDGYKVVVIRELAYIQPSSYIDTGYFRSEDHQKIMDKAVMLIQQLEERLDRTIEFTILDKSNSFDFKISNAVASNLIGINEDADGFEYVDPDEVTIGAQTDHTFTNNQSATDLTDVTVDGAAFTSAVYFYEILRNSKMYTGLVMLHYISSTWEVVDGGNWSNSVTAHNCTFTVSQSSTTAQLKLASDNGSAGGTLKLRRFSFTV